MTLVPGQPVEREIAGGESHTYQISLQRGSSSASAWSSGRLTLALILTAPDGNQLVEMDLTGVGEQESLSLEAAAAGSYRLTVRGSAASSLRGSYRLEITVQAVATAQDRKRLAAEALLLEARKLQDQETKTTEQATWKIGAGAADLA